LNEKPAYFGILTADVRYDKRLKPMEKILFSEISALCDMNGNCEASNSYFAELYEVDPKTVSSWVSNLKKNGYINSSLFYRKNTKEVEKRVLRIIIKSNQDPIHKKVNTPPQKDGDPIHKKMEDINTLTESINNKIYKKYFSLLSAFRKDFNSEIKVSDETILDFIKYRAEIKKPVKTSKPIKLYILELAKCVKAGYNKNEVIELMKNKEWQSLKIDWIKKELSKSEATGWSDHGTDNDDSLEWH